MQINYKKLSGSAKSPYKAHKEDAGWDLTANSISIEHDTITYGTGISVYIPKGYVGLIFPRSSVASKDLILSNCVGVIDSGYTGEIKAKFKKTKINGITQHYNIGDRICQMIIIPYPDIEFIEADALPESERGDGGYGSTGQ